MLDKWIDKYINAQGIEDITQGIDEFREHMSEKDVYLWGAGSVVSSYVDLLGSAGITITGIVDKQKCGEKFSGLNVIRPSELSDATGSILIISSVATPTIASYIEKDFRTLFPSGRAQYIAGYQMFFALQGLFCRKSTREGKKPQPISCILCAQSPGFNCSLIYDNINGQKGADEVVIPKISCNVGTICTLKCKHCSEGIPYIPINKRGFIDIEALKNDFRRISEYSDFISIVEISGGEPLLHPKLEEFLCFLLQMKNIGAIRVITNGTVVPKASMCECLSEPKIHVSISDYTKQLSSGFKEKVSETIKVLEKKGVKFNRQPLMTWSDTSSYEARRLTREEMERAYKSCSFVACRRLHDGVLYPCLHYYTGVMTGRLEDNPDECLHIFETPDGQMRDALRKLMDRTYVSVCDRCLMPFDAPEVEAAEQVSQ